MLSEFIINIVWFIINPLLNVIPGITGLIEGLLNNLKLTVLTPIPEDI